MDHSVLSRRRGMSGSNGLIAGILIKEAFGFIREELPEVSLFQYLVDLDPYCDAVFRLVTVIIKEVPQPV